MSLESICDKQDIVLANIRNVKVLSPDVSAHYMQRGRFLARRKV